MNGKLFYPVLFISFLSFSLSAKEIKGNGNVVTKQMSVADYKTVEFGNGLKPAKQNNFFGRNRTPQFNYTQRTGAATLEITTDENLFSHLEVVVTNGRLVIEVKGKNRIAVTQFIANGSSAGLEYVRLTGGADFNIVSSFTGDLFKADVSSGSDLKFKEEAHIGNCEFHLSGGSDVHAKKLDCNQITGHISGGADLHLGGKAEKATFHSSGGADVHAYDLILTDAHVSSSGGSDVYIHVTGELTGNASGGSDIRYRGEANSRVSTSGGASCKRK
ncbi:MAG: DUF2807 domain-containing protein [Tannerellaceae bacterium]|nr:DUF2807 domain-containing protein [Tannerellaceae bacterium]